MYKLILIRHGQSEWNKLNKFTGWVDIRLSKQGEEEAKSIGKLLLSYNIKADILYTSLLTRAIHTANFIVDIIDRNWIPVIRSWRLNERHYGNLQGKNKDAILEEYGKEQFMLWRRSYKCKPPIIEDQLNNKDDDKRYICDMPESESLEDVYNRILPFYYDTILSNFKLYKTSLVVAHGNSLRALVKHIEKVNDIDIVKYEIATGSAIIYEFDENFNLDKKEIY